MQLSDFETEYANDEKVIAESLTDLDNRIKALVGEDSAILGEFAQAVAGEKSRAEGQEAAIRSEFAAAGYF